MKLLAKAILWIEPLLLVVVVASFWFPEPYRVNTLLLLIPPALARLILYRRIWVNTPLNLFFFLFLVVCIANTYVALSDPLVPPYSWGWYEAAKPVMGVMVALSIASLIYERGRIDGSVVVIVLLGILVGVLGLTSAQFIDKSAIFQPLIDRLPTINNFPGAVGGFNVNEIGGAITYFVPLALGLALYDWINRKNPIRALIATLAFALLALALVLGQSRLAILGVALAVALVIVVVIPNGRWRYVALALVAAFCAFQAGLVLGVIGASGGSAAGLSERDTGELAQRPEIWSAAITLIRQNPLTGVGLNQFRRQEYRNEYVPDFAMVIVPHAHDEFLQVGADTGIPGMILYLGWSLTLVVMIWRAIRKGDPFVKAMAAAAGGGLLAHTIFGLADAITMYDRFGFAYWLFVGLVGGAYLLACRPPALTEP